MAVDVTHRVNQGIKRVDAKRFRRVAEQVGGQWVQFIAIECAHCGATQRIRPPSGDSSDIPRLAAKHFHAMGWVVGSTERGDRCPTHARAPKAEMKPSRIAGVARKDHPMAEPVKSPVARASTPQAPQTPPRAPSVHDRRRIMDALEEHYDVERGFYTASWSDQGLATKLNVPRVWVEAVREMLFGENSGNEAANLRDEAIVGIEQKLAELQDDLLARFSALEADVKRLRGPTVP